MQLPSLLIGDAVLTYSGVVKRWEVDRNDHWNVKFYARAFQMASEVLALAVTGTNPGAASAGMRHHRFRAELRLQDPVRVLSGRIASGPLEGAILHRMERASDGTLAATSIELPSYPVAALPAWDAAMVERALPRGLEAASHAWIDAPQNAAGQPLPVGPAGIVRPADLDHSGDMIASGFVALVTNAAQNFLGGIGLTADWINRNNCNRMAVEMSVTRHGRCSAGDVLDIVCWLGNAGARSFTTRYQISDAASGRPVATVEQLLLMIDLARRTPTQVPDFIRAATASHGPGPAR